MSYNFSNKKGRDQNPLKLSNMTKVGRIEKMSMGVVLFESQRLVGKIRASLVRLQSLGCLAIQIIPRIKIGAGQLNQQIEIFR